MFEENIKMVDDLDGLCPLADWASLGFGEFLDDIYRLQSSGVDKLVMEDYIPSPKKES